MTYKLPATGKPPDGLPLEKIAIEEHVDILGGLSDGAQATKPSGSDEDLQSLVRAMDYNATWMNAVGARLRDFGPDRLAGMDASGISVAILSHTVPGVQGIVDPAAAVTAARQINDRLAAEVRTQPARYAGFASIALQDPTVAPLELERAVTRLGLKGAMINGYTNTRDPQRVEYLDDPKFLPFWEAAASLGAPIYLHPRPALDQRIYDGHSELIGATWGFAPEAATHALRLIYSGLFDRFPTLTVILGHLGETLPYFSWRIQHCFEYNPSDKKVQRRLQDYLCENFYVSTSGIFSDQALIGAMLTIGADRILFAVDYPYEVMEPAARWIERAAISEGDRKKIAAGNARRLFKLP
jgi:predicted TIM-barrel fold metal-dependent hydrolase